MSATGHPLMKRAAHNTLAFIVVLLTLSIGACAPVASADSVLAVHDGDTFTVDGSAGRYKVRLWAVDAPELGQPGCAAARDATAGMLLGNEVTVIKRGMSYGRTVGQVITNGDDLSEVLLRRGVVMLDERYSKTKTYVAAQNYAKGQKLGVWSMDSTPPWVWRKHHSSRGKGCI